MLQREFPAERPIARQTHIASKSHRYETPAQMSPLSSPITAFVMHHPVCSSLSSQPEWGMHTCDAGNLPHQSYAYTGDHQNMEHVAMSMGMPSQMH